MRASGWSQGVDSEAVMNVLSDANASSGEMRVEGCERCGGEGVVEAILNVTKSKDATTIAQES